MRSSRVSLPVSTLETSIVASTDAAERSSPSKRIPPPPRRTRRGLGDREEPDRELGGGRLAVHASLSTAEVLFFAPFTCGSLTVSRAVSAADDTAVPYPGDYLHAYMPPSGEGPPTITAVCMMLSIFLRSSSERSMSAAGAVPSMCGRAASRRRSRRPPPGWRASSRRRAGRRCGRAPRQSARDPRPFRGWCGSCRPGRAGCSRPSSSSNCLSGVMLPESRPWAIGPRV